ncbi:MAG: YjzD family protein [Limosilactobacillus sp.]|uniref:YjzD family protein n=1 Tax=Limosilactobacillus sp. TaxID=2773925 RepID=UPI0026F5F361|nr:YjzD family protein [Limosilactobacillus sp.]
MLSKNIIAAIWGIILAEVLAYITSQLEGMTPDYKLVAIIGVVFALIAVNCINAITGKADPANKD